MKNFLALLIATITLSAHSQTYFEEDFSGGLGGWILVDSDGDENNWHIINYNDIRGNVASSTSWSGGEALTPDNWMIAGPIDLSAATGTVIMEWLAKQGSIVDAADEYSAYAGISSDIAELIASPYSFNEILTTSGLIYSTGLLDITGLAGESEVYIAIRHHNVTDEFRANMDDIIVRDGSEWDIKLKDITVPEVVAAGEYVISGVVQNIGANVISEFDLVWNDGTEHSETFTATIAPGDLYTFEHAVTLEVDDNEVHNLNICAVLADDGDLSNNCVDYVITSPEVIPAKYVVYEERTGTWCGWCPRGIVNMEAMEAEELFIGIEVHYNDPMEVPIYGGAIGLYVPSGFPGGAADRVITGDPSVLSSIYAERSTFVPPASITVTYVEVGDIFEVTVAAHFAGTINRNYRLGLIVIEDEVTGTGSGYSQSNAYSGGGAGAMGGFEDLPSPVPAELMVYDHVARALGEGELIGAPGSLPSIMEEGTTESYTFTIPKNAEWDLAHIKFVGLLLNPENGEMLNAGKTYYGSVGLEDLEAEFELSVYPNPSNLATNVNISLIEASTVNVEIYNALGEIVYTNNSQNLGSGDYTYNVDVSGFSAGMYTVRVVANNTVQTRKLLLN